MFKILTEPKQRSYYNLWINGIVLLAIKNEPILILHRIVRIISAHGTPTPPSAVSLVEADGQSVRMTPTLALPPA